MTVLLIPFQMKCLYFLSDCCGWNFHYFVTEKWQEWACLFYLILKEKLFSFSPLSIILAVDLSLLYSVSCVLTLCDAIDCSMPGFPPSCSRLHHLLEFAQTHVHWVGDVIQPCCPLSPRSPPALSLSQNQGLFLMNWLFASDGQSSEASTSAWSLPMNMQGWLPLGLTGLISLQSKELSGVFSSTTVQKHQFFVTQPSLWSTFHIHTWLLGFVMLLLLSRFSCVWLCATP